MTIHRGRRLGASAAVVCAALAGGRFHINAQGAAYVVAPAGNDALAGTAAAPWRTLQKAAGVVNPGDVVTVRPGAYAGFDLSRSGAPGSPITFLAEPGALINQRNARTPDGINLEGASHIVIDGFAVTGVTRAGVRSVGLPDDFAEFVTVRNVHAYDNGRWGIFTGHVDDLLIEDNETSGSVLEHGIYVSNSGDRPVLRGNTSWGNHGSGIHMNGDESQGGDGIISDALVSGNRIYDNAVRVNGGPLGGGSGINMDGVQNSRIENNLIYGNHASGISLYRVDGAEGASGNVVVNNTIHQAADGRWALNIQDGSTGNAALNNVLVTSHAFRGAIDISTDSLPGFVSDYNAVASRFTLDGNAIVSLSQWRTATGQDQHSFVATAGVLFVDLAALDYRLQMGAPAIDAGAADEAPAVDFFGAARNVGVVDVGAVEFGTLAADFNSDGNVDGADLSAWRLAFGASAAADADGDSDSDGADFLAWQRQAAGGAQGAAAQTVPEPAAYCLVGIVLWAWRRAPWPRAAWACSSRRRRGLPGGFTGTIGG